MPNESIWLAKAKELGPWVISLVALTQVWIVALWKRFVIRPTLELYEADTLEIGFGSLGPTVAIRGTLRVMRKDAFVRRMSLIVTRQRDSASHQFAWAAHRPDTIRIGANDPVQLQLTASFLLTVSTPWHFNTVFVEQPFRAELQPKLAQSNKDWLQFVRKKVEGQTPELQMPLSDILRNPANTEPLYSDYAQEPIQVELWSWLDRAFYWTPGKYTVDVSVETVKAATLAKRFHFSLDEMDSQNLRLNSVAIAREACGFQSIYNFAYPKSE